MIWAKFGGLDGVAIWCGADVMGFGFVIFLIILLCIVGGCGLHKHERYLFCKNFL
ncbi:hypothetical protein [Moraxella nasicaprae]|uniref:Uncharacterized protein n=1 Tax=Moraxella nasicaprae TaxID=2904122 RepID=A0ABY6F591_9GAMM|nr:hypothetical protein [Moraxella nasicaprae]UXZ05271.1 hypothetical protein LU297_02120 [Moraxella nasicaprae]